MLRALLVTTTLAAVIAAPALAQQRSPRFGRSADDWCSGSSNQDRAVHCEVREATIPGVSPLDIDAGRNGGISVRGWDRGDVFVRAKIVAYGDTDADARRVAAAVRVDSAGGRVRADGPETTGDEHWSVSFEVQVPRTASLTLNTHNGGIVIEQFRGMAEFHAQNGGVMLNDVAGDIHGATTNGGLNIDLHGTQWDGAGLNVETRNGGIRLQLPANYSAELETGTTNGRVAIDFPITVQGSVGRHFTTTLGAGGAKLRAITTNGGVTIHQTP
jgi:hypothetical protein